MAILPFSREIFPDFTLVIAITVMLYNMWKSTQQSFVRQNVEKYDNIIWHNGMNRNKTIPSSIWREMSLLEKLY